MNYAQLNKSTFCLKYVQCDMQKFLKKKKERERARPTGKEILGIKESVKWTVVTGTGKWRRGRERRCERGSPG